MDAERGISERMVASGEGNSMSDSIRVTRGGKLHVWVKNALDFFKNHPDKPLVLYSPPADVSTSTISRLVSVVEIIKREYLKAQDISKGDVSGLHQYNQLLFERGDIPVENGDERQEKLGFVLGGRTRPKQSLAPQMKITLATKADILHASRETYQAAAIRRMSKRARKRVNKQGESIVATC